MKRIDCFEENTVISSLYPAVPKQPSRLDTGWRYLQCGRKARANVGSRGLKGRQSQPGLNREFKAVTRASQVSLEWSATSGGFGLGWAIGNMLQR